MKGPTYHSVSSTENTPPSPPLEHATILAKLCFSWVTPLLQLGNDRPLHAHDIWPLQPAYQCSIVGRAFEPAFDKTRSLLTTMASLFGWEWASVGLMQVAAVLGTLYGPIVLHQIVASLESHSFEMTTGLALVGSLVAVRFVGAFLSTHAALQTQLIVIKVTSALQHLLYQKALRLDAAARRATSTGEISNLFLTDISTIVNFSTVCNQLWILPLQIGLTVVLLYLVIGWSTLAGVALIVATLVVNQFVVLRMHAHLGAMMGCKDARMKAVDKTFGAIQTVKLNAWEDRFHDKLSTCRRAELASLGQVFWTNSIATMVVYVGPTLVTIASFAVYTLVQKESLTASKIFTVLSLFALLKTPFSTISILLSSLMRALVSVQRIMTFLNLPEKPSTVLTLETIDDVMRAAYATDDLVIAICDATVGWEEATPLFRHLDLVVKRGEFVVVAGAVGQGKSTLCAALLGETATYPCAGSIFVGGHVAYFSQQPWLQHLTIRDNILFGLPYDQDKYSRVLDACALTQDLVLFPAGDQTQIGQKGVTLSGGQKARVSLARACYSNADIFILDSPLSAVDAIVANEIFTKCFLGLLRHKTILLVTHAPEIIASPAVDRVLEVKDGRLMQVAANHPIRRGDSQPLVQPLASLTNVSWTMTPCVSRADAADQLVHDEARSNGSIAASVYRGYIDAMGGWCRLLWLVLVLATWQGMTVASDVWLNIWSNTSETTLFADRTPYYLGVYAGLSLTAVLFIGVRNWVMFRSGLQASATLFDRMTHALLHAPIHFFDANPLGRILNRYANDMSTLDLDLPWTIMYLASTTCLAGCTLVTALYLTKALGLVALPCLYLYYVFGAFYAAPARDLERVNKLTKSPLLNLVAESIDGVVVVRAFGASVRFQRDHCGHVDGTNKSMLASEVATQWLVLRIQLVSTAVLATALVLSRDQLTPGLVGLALNYLFSSLSLLETLVPKFAQFQTVLVAPERILEYCEDAMPMEPPRVLPGAVAATWPMSGALEFDHMSFRYKDTSPLVLKDVHVSIVSGEKIGIVGRTGAGKSSLTMALFRMHDAASGSIRIDGVDIATIGVHTLRRAIAIIPQTPVLFQGTLRTVLDPCSDFDDAQLWACLHKVKLADRVAAAPTKLNSPVDENGENFSIGERQLLCMARALLRQAKIVILDEATAAMDHDTDRTLQRVIRTSFASSTVLTIAHRLDTVMDSDRIFVFDQGRLVQCDAPMTLVGQGSGIFYELYTEGGYADKPMV
ncbi:Aste57867_8103 [Aphanomyces stellatus]|uniref:Aste57867_8103 protein n=1 Tax=Aphanomyces stellatus TaxID=120398 RepID=A0A485KJC6_9STRA|nr:hypothetical protein As57867_008073 [Aphanomyces stellatus]VFT84992.1 Aste57867_8103 [Aphanomyces stellatus]